MKAKVLWVLLIFFGLWSSPAAADNRFIVRAPSGLTFLQQVLQQVCSVLVSCNVVGGLDGTLNKVFLVTTPDFLDPNAFLQILRSQPGIAPQTVPARIAAKVASTGATGHGTPGQSAPTAAAASAPRVSCPSAPMLNNPA